MMQTITNKSYEISFDKKRTLRIKLLNNTSMDVIDSIENSETTNQLTKGEKHFILIDAGNSIFTTNKQIPSTSKFDDNRIAKAYIVSNIANKLLGNFYLGINKQPIPTKVFSNEAEAVVWFDNLLYLSEINNKEILEKELI